MLVFVFIALLPALILSQETTTSPLGAELFHGIDADKDGRINKNEAEKFFLTFDNDHNDDVSYKEFTTALDSISPSFAGHELVLFNIFDLERNQHVDKNDIDLVFTIVDTNGDGVVTEDEFTNMFGYIIGHLGNFTPPS